MYSSLNRKELNERLSNKFDISLAKNFTIYKGIASAVELGDFYYHEPNNSIRESKTAPQNGNLYNLLLNNLEGWSRTPQRARSVIGTTCYTTAKGFATISNKEGKKYGKVYVLIPQIDVVLAIAPKSDIWYSFDFALKQFNLTSGGVSLKAFNTYFGEIFGKEDKAERFDSTWLSFSDHVQQFANSKLENSKNLSKNSKILLKSIRKNRGNLMNFINTAFLPRNNGFQFVKFNSSLQLARFPNNEVWTESPCLFVEKAIFDAID